MSEFEENNYNNVSKVNGQEDLPALYSKTLILIVAILFSTIFAAALLMYNLNRIGQKKAMWWVLIFAVSFLILTGVVIQVFKLDPGMTLIANVIGAAVLNEFFWNRFIGRDTEFEKKSWIKPILISLLIAMVLFILLIGAAQI